MSDPRRLKLLSIAHPAVSSDGGRLRYYQMAARDDVDVHLVIPAVWHEFGRTMVAAPSSDPRLTLHVLPIRLARAGPLSWYLHFYPGLGRLIRELQPDVIHLWEEPWGVVALQARVLKGRAALVMEVDQNILKRLPPPFEWIRKQVLRNTDHVLSRSPDATAVVRARGYLGPVSRIGYGVDLSNFHPGVEPAIPRTTWPDFRIGYVGRLVEEKGLDDALEAMMLTAMPVSLAIMGEGPYAERLRQRVAELGLSDRVSFRGWGTPADVAAFLRSLDATVLLTRTTRSVREQFGRVIVESQACGVPVIGSQSGAIPDVVGDGGWIVPERDPAALAKQLDVIMSQPQSLQAHGFAAQSNVKNRFTYGAVADDLLAACMAAVQSRNA
ncbi:MAG: glycosyl transferase, group 1 [Tardiphaga sp.]|uniref:glycosyltransferase n=1 Tax=Tardiphaga sp. TaxID=1926292 RepID=UPI00261057B6|nr:glycosyltransferase [Tardiphaga sp.]MDB5500313.1 glycosyl transferase, group 1 [Tardiphaga sp.]